MNTLFDEEAKLFPASFPVFAEGKPSSFYPHRSANSEPYSALRARTGPPSIIEKRRTLFRINKSNRYSVASPGSPQEDASAPSRLEPSGPAGNTSSQPPQSPDPLRASLRRAPRPTTSVEPCTVAASPSQLAALPKDKERAPYSAVLDELQSTGRTALRKIPVYYVNRNTRGYVLPTHGYVVAGEPGKGRKSGAVLYGVGGDPTRGPVTLDDRLMKRLNARTGRTGAYKLPEPIRAAIADLSGKSFASREDFYRAYSHARGEGVDPSTVHEEMASVYRLLPIWTMELWPKRTGDYRVAKPAAPERDIRAFEHLPKDIGHKVVLKKISGVESIDLLEAKRQFMLHQLYQDERLGRNGTGIPSEEHFPPTIDAESRRSLAASTPRFQRLPPYTTDKVGNCNSGAASLLQRAMVQYHATGAKWPRRATAASVFGLGSGHRIAIWDPLKPRHSTRKNEAATPIHAPRAMPSTISSAPPTVGAPTKEIHTALVGTWSRS
ncbi:hypothetical protein [Ralstonia solanacearum]|uniref:hypothetical protein n=1 Tax=Ralstonia solanacearum TaxID=305 RepID=UPI000AADB394|nr:hypothetical protein [Ralstonia solanacearum]